MKTMFRKGLVALMATFALGAVASNAASAHEFEFEAVGKFKRVSNTTQVFTTKTGGNVVECTTDSVTGNNSEITSWKNLHLEVAYSGCKLVGFGAVTVSNAKYLFNAEGTATLENTVTVSLGSFCKSSPVITLPAQENLKPVTYENTPVKDVTFNLKFEKIRSQGEINSELKCLTVENTTGTYTGKTAIEMEGHSWDWK